MIEVSGSIPPRGPKTCGSGGSRSGTLVCRFVKVFEAFLGKSYKSKELEALINI
jgi:hypothetical protein